MKVYQEVICLIVEGGSGVLVTLVDTDGATPRKPGTKMLVLPDGRITGTIGGGRIEREVRRLVPEVLTENEPRLVSIDENGDEALATDAGFIGLLGSRKKKSAFFSTLREEGVSEEQLARVKTPVGLAIGARTPAEIGVSVMAQLIQRQRRV